MTKPSDIVNVAIVGAGGIAREPIEHLENRSRQNAAGA